MAEYISKEDAVDAGYLSDWYIASVNDEPPVWTDAHINELLNDFIVIPKDTKSADVQPVNRWISVKDCVPEAGVHVLVTDGIHMMVTWCEYVDNQCLWVDNYYTYVNVRFKEVTHWMPLPKFPKEG